MSPQSKDKQAAPAVAKKKIFIIDTNVILHDYRCIHNFEDNDIIIPITVLEEIDGFKRGHGQIHFNAREFIRILDELPGEVLVNSGASLGKKRGKIKIMTNHQLEPKVKQIFSETKSDHRILSVAYYLTKKFPERSVILVSKDVNLRLKARSLNVLAQDYFSDRIKDLDTLYIGKRCLKNIASALVDRLFQPDGALHPDELNIDKLTSNEYFIIKNEHKSVLGHFSSRQNKITRVLKEKTFGISPRNAEQTFAFHALTHPQIQLATITGKAGTGKTLMALAAALKVRKEFKQIYVARPIIPLSNRDLGYLPGDLNEKMDPYMQPLYDNLHFIRDRFPSQSKEYQLFEKMFDQEKLFISPLAYIRGRSLERIFFIVDEAQNLTPHEVKTIITRAGEGTKVVFTGDIYQIDTPYLDSQSNGLTYLIDRMKGQEIYAHINLEKGERSYLSSLAGDLL